MKKILVCVPTFNESENIKILCKKILRIKKIDLLIVDDNSPDKTWAVVENLRLKNKNLFLIKRKRREDLETLLRTNPEVGQNPKAVKFLINEYLSSANIKSACEKINFIDRRVQNTYLEKFTIYCLINNDRKEEANLIFDILKERGFEDKFFEDKINFLLGISDTTTQKILDNNLLNFYFSKISYSLE